MTSDAKLGLLAGMAAVLLIAVVYHRQPQANGGPPASPPAPKPTSALPPPLPVSVSPRPNGELSLPIPSAPADPLVRGPVE